MGFRTTESVRACDAAKTAALACDLPDRLVSRDCGVCVFQPLELRNGLEIVLRRLETAMLFSAMMLAIVLEAALVYWIFEDRASTETSFSVAGKWTGASLPQGWLFGALCVLAYRVTVIVSPSTSSVNADKRRNRTAFIHLWKWTVALIAIQGLALFLGHANAP